VTSIALDSLYRRPEWLRRNGLIALLTIALLLMTALVIEQGRVIATQGTLVKELFQDSNTVNAIRSHLNHRK